ncbi:MAG TPA: ABC transporter substrate-binding protein, partial [Acidimicrobiia bacterium]
MVQRGVARERRGYGGLRRAVVGVLAAVVLVSACGSSGSSNNKSSGTSGTSTTASKGVSSSTVEKFLGAPKQATGEPVKVGVISDGRNPAADNSIEGDVAKDTFAYLDGYGGIGGRPVKVYVCETHGDPGGATDCANQMIQNGVVAVVIGQSQVVTNVYTPLHAAHMPTFVYGVFDPNVLGDTTSTFAFGNPFAALSALPIAVAKANKIKKVAATVIDVPAATSFWESEGPAQFKKAGISLDVVRIPYSAADVTPQMQRIVSSGAGLVHAVGSSGTCTAVMNGLHAVGYTGKITVVQQCVDASTRKAVPGSVLKGVNESATAPVDGHPPDPGLAIYQQEIAPKVKGHADAGSAGELMFISIMGFHVAVEGITGDITSQNVIATAKKMPWKLLPGGGVHFRCSGKAVSGSPALCVRAGLVTQLDAKGQPTVYKAV